MVCLGYYGPSPPPSFSVQTDDVRPCPRGQRFVSRPRAPCALRASVCISDIICVWFVCLSPLRPAEESWTLQLILNVLREVAAPEHRRGFYASTQAEGTKLTDSLTWIQITHHLRSLGLEAKADLELCVLDALADHRGARPSPRSCIVRCTVSPFVCMCVHPDRRLFFLRHPACAYVVALAFAAMRPLQCAHICPLPSLAASPVCCACFMLCSHHGSPRHRRYHPFGFSWPRRASLSFARFCVPPHVCAIFHAPCRGKLILVLMHAAGCVCMNVWLFARRPSALQMLSCSFLSDAVTTVLLIQLF